jgi:hypothetical protein
MLSVEETNLKKETNPRRACNPMIRANILVPMGVVFHSRYNFFPFS